MNNGRFSQFFGQQRVVVPVILLLLLQSRHTPIRDKPRTGLLQNLATVRAPGSETHVRPWQKRMYLLENPAFRTVLPDGVSCSRIPSKLLTLARNWPFLL